MRATTSIPPLCALLAACGIAAAACGGTAGTSGGLDGAADAASDRSGGDARIDETAGLDQPADRETPAADAADPGDIGDAEGSARHTLIVDPDNPRWLRWADGAPFFACGPGDPEGFLYRGTRNADGTRAGDQEAIIAKLAASGANTLYMQVVRSHGGDGGADENPFTGGDPSRPLSEPILAQWEAWLRAMDAAGIVAFLFVYDDSSRIWDTGDAVGEAERAFVRTLAGRFSEIGALVWVVAEEYGERYSAARVSAIAAELKAADGAHHAVGVHKNHGLGFSELADDPRIDLFAIQYNVDTAGGLHDGMTQAWDDAAGRYCITMAEAAGHGTGKTARVKNWAAAMGGAYVMVLGWMVADTAAEDLAGCGALRRFFEDAGHAAMAPHDELARGGTEYVMALPGQGYIAYASGLRGALGVAGMPAGRYDLTWLDIATGARVAQEGVAVENGEAGLAPPGGVGAELAVHARKAP